MMSVTYPTKDIKTKKRKRHMTHCWRHPSPKNVPAKKLNPQEAVVLASAPCMRGKAASARAAELEGLPRPTTPRLAVCHVESSDTASDPPLRERSRVAVFRVLPWMVPVCPLDCPSLPPPC